MKTGVHRQTLRRGPCKLGISIPKLQRLAKKIGKRSLFLNKKAIAVAEEIQQLESRAAQWVAKDALRELRSAKVRRRLSQKNTLHQTQSGRNHFDRIINA